MPYIKVPVKKSDRARGHMRTMYVNDAAADTNVAGSIPADGEPFAPDVKLLTEHPSLVEVKQRFADAGIELHVVGGPVRDLISEGHPGNDLDLASPADVETVKNLLNDLGAIPDTGQEFGTVKLFREGHPDVEITQYRAEKYREDSRKPETVSTENFVDDLSRRDATVNAMGVNMHTGELIDPYGGREDLAAGVLRPPGDPDVTFSDDPLRIIRFARFGSTRGWEPNEESIEAAQRQSHRLDVVASERVLVEFDKTLKSERPEALREAIRHSRTLGAEKAMFGGFDTKTAEQYDLESLPPSARLSALAYATPKHRDVMRDMKMSNDVIQHVSQVKGAAEHISGAETEIDMRRAVRSYNDEELDEAERVLAAAGKQESYALKHARSRADVWRAKLPVDGNDALERGMKGREIGDWLRKVEDAHVSSSAGISREQAMSIE